MFNTAIIQTQHEQYWLNCRDKRRTFQENHPAGEWIPLWG
jgi:hypothetical protein